MGERRQAVFVVKMWSEPTDRGAPVWRGSIDSVSTQHRFYFANIGAMCEFMLAERDRAPIEAPGDAPDPPAEGPGSAKSP